VRAIICSTCLKLSMLDGLLMLHVNLPVAVTIHSKGNKFFMGVKSKAAAESKLYSHDSPDVVLQ